MQTSTTARQRSRLAECAAALWRGLSPVFSGNVVQRTRPTEQLTSYENLPVGLFHSNVWWWARLFVSEIRTTCQRIQFRYKILGRFPRICLDVACPPCRVEEYRSCSAQLLACTGYIEHLQAKYPWVGWEDIYLVVETWKVAIGIPYCTAGKSDSLPKPQRACSTSAISLCPPALECDHRRIEHDELGQRTLSQY